MNCMHVAGIFPEQSLPKHMWIAISALLSKNLIFFHYLYLSEKAKSVTELRWIYNLRFIYTDDQDDKKESENSYPLSKK